MKRASNVLLPLALLVALASAGWFALSDSVKPVQAENSDAVKEVGSGILDGMTFVGEVGLLGKPADIKDDLVFSEGNFLSVRCERLCNYPARPYFVREVDGVVEFVSETKCPTKDAKIVWRGTVDGDSIKGVFTWTSSRWYWTIEKQFWFEGKLVEQSRPIASN